MKKIIFIILMQLVFYSAYGYRSVNFESPSSLNNLLSTTGYAVGEFGAIIKTTNGGDNWISQTSITTSDLNSVFVIAGNSVCAVGNKGAIITTTNGGTTWTSHTFDTTLTLNSVFFTDLLNGVAVGNSGKILQTTDGGTSWSTIPPPVTDNLNEVYFDRPHLNGFISGNNGKVLYSSNMGSSWSTKPFISSANLTSIFVDSNSATANIIVLATGADGKVYKSTNKGTTWTSTTLTGFTLNSINFNGAISGTGVIVGNSGKTFRTTNAGTNWDPISFVPVTPNFNSVCLFTSSQAWITGDNNTVIKTTNGGVSWFNQSLPFNGILLEENFNYPTNDTLGNYAWYAIKHASINPLKATSPGLTFSGYTLSGIGNATTMAIAAPMSGEDSYKNLYGIDSTGSIYASFMVNVTSATAGGDYFFSFYPESRIEYIGRVSARINNDSLNFGITKSTGSDIPVWTHGYKFNSTYLVVLKYNFVPGSTTNDLISLFVISGVIPATEPPATIGPSVFTGSTDAVNIGKILLRQGDGTPNCILDGIRVTTSWNPVIVSVQNNSGSIPENFYLEQNFPNPFNPETTIKFNIRSKEFVKLIVYDCLGKEVEKLVNEELNEGSYNIQFKGNNLPSGVYFYTLVTNKFTQTRKMILIK